MGMCEDVPRARDDPHWEAESDGECVGVLGGVKVSTPLLSGLAPPGLRLESDAVGGPLGDSRGERRGWCRRGCEFLGLLV